MGVKKCYSIYFSIHKASISPLLYLRIYYILVIDKNKLHILTFFALFAKTLREFGIYGMVEEIIWFRTFFQMIYDATYYSTLNVICYNPILSYRTCILFYRALILSYRALIFSSLLFNINNFLFIISCYSTHNVIIFTIISYRIAYQSYTCILFYCAFILSYCALILSYCALILSYYALILHVSGLLFNFNSCFVYHIVSIFS